MDAKLSLSVDFSDIEVFHGKGRKISNFHSPLRYSNQHLNKKI